jgi:putative restriction endonuclease
MPHRLPDHRVRLAAFEWLQSQVLIYGEVLLRPLLEQGFQLDGERIPLVGPQGIFKPRVLERIPLSITTTLEGPYDDVFAPNGLLRYKYRGTDPLHHENMGLREAMRQNLPLVYFHGIVPSKYLAVWPIFIVNDRPELLTFEVAVDDATIIGKKLQQQATNQVAESDEARRIYITSTVRVRLHQTSFREKVLRAYREQCTLCRLRHAELLDAAHIIPDTDPEGEPIISNGLALCKLHHAAFDRHFLGIRPDYIVELRRDVLDEEDGPMLLHGLKGMHLKRLSLPRMKHNWPDPERLEQRYFQFLAMR